VINETNLHHHVGEEDVDQVSIRSEHRLVNETSQYRASARYLFHLRARVHISEWNPMISVSCLNLPKWKLCQVTRWEIIILWVRKNLVQPVFHRWKNRHWAAGVETEVIHLRVI